ncbi:MAG: D-alanine--D-alanine ligase [Treponema sp.]|jgi:D-alanine-D-alanine ligase|nr:D-alanine--D-alanine ligase [Treponema sp.]
MEKKIKVCILFGGKSAEHEVSLQSAKNVYDALDRNKYEPVLMGITKAGRWVRGEASRFLLNAEDPGRIKLIENGEPVSLISDNAPPVDVVFPILHGPFGEDGTVQGLLKLAGLPFVGSSVLGSAAAMDKDVMKRLLRDARVPIGRYRALQSHEKFPSYEEVSAELGEILFIKPANMGSSVGVSKVHNREEYHTALENAFRYDTKLVIEEFIQGREIECSVLGNEEAIASLPGEICASHEFYSYEAKYLDEKGAVLKIPADLPPEIIREVQDLAVKTFHTLCCEGLSRVDFFVREEGSARVIVNEINTMPGFTRISMYPKLWEASGISYSELIDRLIQLALQRFAKENKLKTSYLN